MLGWRWREGAAASALLRDAAGRSCFIYIPLTFRPQRPSTSVPMTTSTSTSIAFAELTEEDASALEQLAAGGGIATPIISSRVRRLLAALAGGIAAGKRVVLLDEGGYFTVEQVAQILQISMPHLQLLIRAGRVATLDRDGTEVVSTPDVLQAMEDERVMQRLIDGGQSWSGI